MTVTDEVEQMKQELAAMKGNPMKLANSAARMTDRLLDMVGSLAKQIEELKS